jgi:type II secretory pathway pseudopilin PulG
MMKKTQDNGYSLTEALFSLVIMSLVVVNSIDLYVNARKVQVMTVHKKVAIETINSKLEYFKDNYSQLPATSPQVDTGVMIGTLPATQTVTVENVDENGDGLSDGYKKVTVQLDWTETALAGKAMQVHFCTYLAP